MANLSQFNGGLLKFNKNQYMAFSGASAVQSTAFDSETVAILISCRRAEDLVHIEIGSNPTATITSFFIRGYNESGEQNGGGQVVGPIGVTPGHKLSAIAAGGGNTGVHIMELKY